MCLPPLWLTGLFSFAEYEDMRADMIFQDLIFWSKNLSQPGWPYEQRLSMIIALQMAGLSRNADKAPMLRSNAV